MSSSCSSDGHISFAFAMSAGLFLVGGGSGVASIEISGGGGDVQFSALLKNPKNNCLIDLIAYLYFKNYFMQS